MVILTNIGSMLVGVEEVVSIGQTNTSLLEVEGNHVRVLLILGGVHGKQRLNAQRMHVGNHGKHIGRTLHTCNSVQIGLKRIQLLLFDGNGIHTAVPEVADLLGIATLCTTLL